MTEFEHVFPAMRGVQAQREYYVSMFRLSLIPKLTFAGDEDLVPELRAQRTLSRGRISKITRYVIENAEDYVFSALTASVDGNLTFEPVLEADSEGRVGLLHVPMAARILINDGQHRRAAIEKALHERPELGHESISIVLFMDSGLERCQQMFADLNRYAVRPSKSLALLYDHRDVMAQVSKEVMNCAAFRGVVDGEKSALAKKSRKLFTLSALHSATSALLGDRLVPEDFSCAAQLAINFWSAVDRQIPEWGAVRRGEITAGEVRRAFVHTHGVILQALGRAGYALTHAHPTSWPRQLEHLREVDWSRTNAATWEGRAMIGGQISKARHNVMLTTNALKTVLRLELTPEEHRAETAFMQEEVTA